MREVLTTPFHRVVVTGVECSGKTTLSKQLAAHLGWGWVPEHARTHQDVLSGKVSESTFDALHESQTDAASQHWYAAPPLKSPLDNYRGT